MSKQTKGWSDGYDLLYEKHKSNEKNIELRTVVNQLGRIRNPWSAFIQSVRNINRRILKRG